MVYLIIEKVDVICGGGGMKEHGEKGAGLKIDFAQIPDHVKDELAHATLQAVNEFLKQPGGREFLDSKKAALREKRRT